VKYALILSVLATVSGAAAAQTDPILDELGLYAYDVQGLDLPPQYSADFSFEVELNGRPVTLDLRPHSMRSPLFHLRVQDASGVLNEITDPPPPCTYRGEIRGVAGTVVAASLTDEGLRALILGPNDENWGIQPVADAIAGMGNELHVVYRAADTFVDGECGVTDNAFTPAPSGLGSFQGSGLQLCEIAFDSDVQYYGDNGNSVNNSINDIENILNGVEAIYQSDVNIIYELTELIIRTSEPDPYTTSNPSGLLGEFASHWNLEQDHVHRDVAHLMTGRNLSGSTIGIASLFGMCGGYGLSQRIGGLTSRIGLACHEIGHNWGAPHCSSPDCRIMCPSLGGCTGDLTQFGAAGTASVLNGASIANCAPEIPAPLEPPFLDTWSNITIDTDKWITSSIQGGGGSWGFVPSPPWTFLLNGRGNTTIVGEQIASNRILMAGESGYVFSLLTTAVNVENGESLEIDYMNSSGSWVNLLTVVSDGQLQFFYEFHEVALPAAAYHDGFRIRISAIVDEIDDEWHLDNIRISDQPVCDQPVPYGVAKTTSWGQQPFIYWTGQNSLLENDLVIGLEGATPFQLTVNFWGTGTSTVPFANGTIWIAAPLNRGPVQMLDEFGHTERPIVIDPSMVGTTRNYQWFFRDPAHPDGTGVGLSSGLEVLFCD
jgi:hypothetical protein